MKKRRKGSPTPEHFHRRHATHGVVKIKIAGGAKTLHKCASCDRAHVETHAATPTTGVARQARPAPPGPGNLSFGPVRRKR